jgi:serpin B
MKTLLYALLFVFGGIAVLAAQPPATAMAAHTADQAEIVKGGNAFAADLYAQLRSKPGNLFFSPESISTAFAMAYAGARGQTAAEMEKVFHFTLPPERLHPAMGALLAEMNGTHPGYELHVADALWAQQNQNFLPAYLNLVKTDYGAGFKPMDFATAPEAARATINNWVAQETNDKIQDLLGPGTVTPATLLVLTNAIYFKGAWLDPFEKGNTEIEDFHLDAKQTVKAAMMGRTGGYNYYDGGAFEALELPYKGGELSMVILLPKKIDGLAALEKSFTAANLTKWLDKLTPEPKVNLLLPRFKMTQDFDLGGTLSAMGMPQAFGNAADFSGMTGKPAFQISKAVHKAYVDVDETGTEAAAATGIVMVGAMMRERETIIPFIADHPFLFLIRDKTTGSVLFLGRLMDPTK